MISPSEPEPSVGARRRRPIRALPRPISSLLLDMRRWHPIRASTFQSGAIPVASEGDAQPPRMPATSVVERAFEVAGSCTSIEDIRRVLREEGFSQVDAHLGGRMIRRQLKLLLKGAPDTPDENLPD